MHCMTTVQCTLLHCVVVLTTVDSSPQQVISGTLSANPPLMLHILAVCKEEDLSVKKKAIVRYFIGPRTGQRIETLGFIFCDLFVLLLSPDAVHSPSLSPPQYSGES